MMLNKIPSSYPFVSDEFELGSRILDRIFASNHPTRMCLKCMGQNFKLETDEKTLKAALAFLLEYGLIKPLHSFNGLKENDNYSITEEGKRAQKENLPVFLKRLKSEQENLQAVTAQAKRATRHSNIANLFAGLALVVSVLTLAATMWGSNHSVKSKETKANHAPIMLPDTLQSSPVLQPATDTLKH